MSVYSVATGGRSRSIVERFNKIPVLGDFESIATVTLATSAASITFSDIPQGYKHLQVRGVLKKATSNGNWGCIKVNGSTSGYASHLLSGNGATPSASGLNSLPFGYFHGLVESTIYCTAVVIDILDYSNTSKNTTIKTFAGNDYNGSGGVSITSSLWASTTAVSSFSYGLDIYNLGIDSSLCLYGIRG